MDRFDNRMRFEWADPEQRVLLYSWGFAILIAILWLITVALYKITPKPFFPDDSVEIELTPTPNVPQPPETKTAAGETDVTKAPAPKEKPPGSRDREKGNPKPKPSGAPKETNSAGAIGSAFGTGSNRGSGGITGDVSSMLRNVAVASGGGGSGAGAGGAGGGGTGGKVVLGGQGGEGGTRPGIGGFGGGPGTGGGGGIGTGVGGGGGGIGRSTVRVAGPASVRAPDVVGNRRDVGELGVFVRSRESQLRYCYQEFGLKANPALAGTVTVAISLTGSGDVTGVNVANRTWSGPGAAESESCIRNKIRQWRFPAAAEGGGTYTFPFNFTK